MGTLHDPAVFPCESEAIIDNVSRISMLQH